MAGGLLLLCLLGGVIGCGGQTLPPPAKDLLLAMLEVVPTHPAGHTYTRTADPSGNGYLRCTLFAALYGPAGRGWLGTDAPVTAAEAGAGEKPERATDALIRDAGLFLSDAPHPFEVGVFRCATVDDALSVASLCRCRLELLRNVWRDSEYASLVARGTVSVEGCYVLLVVAGEPDALLEAARARLR